MELSTPPNGADNRLDICNREESHPLFPVEITPYRALPSAFGRYGASIPRGGFENFGPSQKPGAFLARTQDDGTGFLRSNFGLEEKFPKCGAEREMLHPGNETVPCRVDTGAEMLRVGFVVEVDKDSASAEEQGASFVADLMTC